MKPEIQGYFYDLSNEFHLFSLTNYWSSSVFSNRCSIKSIVNITVSWMGFSHINQTEQLELRIIVNICKYVWFFLHFSKTFCSTRHCSKVSWSHGKTISSMLSSHILSSHIMQSCCKVHLQTLTYGILFLSTDNDRRSG